MAKDKLSQFLMGNTQTVVEKFEQGQKVKYTGQGARVLQNGDHVIVHNHGLSSVTVKKGKYRVDVSPSELEKVAEDVAAPTVEQTITNEPAFHDLVNELSYNTLSRYIDKAEKSVRHLERKGANAWTRSDAQRAEGKEKLANKNSIKAFKINDKIDNRQGHIATAYDKFHSKLKEDIEPVEEVSQERLHRYISKGDRSYDSLNNKAHKEWKSVENLNKIGAKDSARKQATQAKATGAKADRRAKFLNKAEAKLREKYEPVEEISQNLKSNYVRKAAVKRAEHNSAALNAERDSRWAETASWARNRAAAAKEHRHKEKNREEGIKRANSGIKTKPLVITNHGQPKD